MPYYKEPNYLDNLEEFWLSKDYMVPTTCGNNDLTHFIGMKDDCGKCTIYRDTGDF